MRRNPLGILSVWALAALLGGPGCARAQADGARGGAPLELGAFSVSLNVKDIRASMAFYQKLDFKPVAGRLEQNWIVLRNGNATIGLFQGLLRGNVMTFNPGWTQDKQTLADFQDVRELQRVLQARGVALSAEAKPGTEGPAFIQLVDPDGNVLLFDQHVPSPKRSAAR